MFEKEQKEILIRGLASLSLLDQKAHYIMSRYLSGEAPRYIIDTCSIPERTFHRKFQEGRSYLLSFIESDTLPFRVDLKFPRVK